ncbi:MULTISPECIES: nucleotidyltransferase family protein [Terrabacteria group]|uniref:tRNA(Met) cytidine acetate ligase n=1 Tax=Bacillati TaxID=1783272 RepID=UPI001C6E51CB|nr:MULTISPECIES: nucleotidyltransferase family protein [Terrabacteria group]MBW9212288.1 nucleotidyltransferase family protein [Trueperella sp. zg.1013]
MKTCGIVVEYNPFHFGHLYQIQKIKKELQVDAIIVVISGNFVQRGEPALLDKWTRTEDVLKQGVDVVIELPYIYASQSASQFAKAAIKILQLAQVDYVCFGSECGNLENLKEIAQTPVNPDYLHEAMRDGSSFPKAYSLLTGAMLPNDILAVSYLKALENSSIQPYLIQRQGEAYHSLENKELASAQGIRYALRHKQDVSKATPLSFQGKQFHHWNEYYPFLRFQLLSSTRKELQSFFLVQEGIEKHLINCAKECENFEKFINMAVNYRYTQARIQRTCLQILNHIKKEDVQSLKPLHQFRILGFNTIGRKWLKENKKLPAVVKFSKLDEKLRQIELRTTYSYALVHHEQELIEREVKGPIFIEVTSNQ